MTCQRESYNSCNELAKYQYMLEDFSPPPLPLHFTPPPQLFNPPPPEVILVNIIHFISSLYPFSYSLLSCFFFTDLHSKIKCCVIFILLDAPQQYLVLHTYVHIPKLFCERSLDGYALLLLVCQPHQDCLHEQNTITDAGWHWHAHISNGCWQQTLQARLNGTPISR